MKNVKKTRIMIVMTLGFLMGPTALANDSANRSPAVAESGIGEKKWTTIPMQARNCGPDQQDGSGIQGTFGGTAFGGSGAKGLN